MIGIFLAFAIASLVPLYYNSWNKHRDSIFHTHRLRLSKFPAELSTLDHLRPTIESDVPLLIKHYFPTQIHIPLPMQPLDEFRYSYPNYGDLEFPEESKMGQPRQIIHNDLSNAQSSNHETMRKQREMSRDLRSSYLAFDDDQVRRRSLDYKNNQCQRHAWHRMYYPSCNTFHEMDLANTPGEGYLRQVFELMLLVLLF